MAADHLLGKDAIRGVNNGRAEIGQFMRKQRRR